MKKTIINFILCLFGSVLAIAQSEDAIWVFGDYGGLNFNTGSPQPYSNNLLLGYEGSASICNSSGQLLFYTNGFWVWNRDHEIMPELTGGVSGYIAPVANLIGYPPMIPWNGTEATQQAAIAAWPDHNGFYYLFSLSNSGQLFYSLIDMSLNNGKGGIVAGEKSVPVATGLAEKMTVVKGCNNIWLMARSRTANQYRAYEINDTGIVTTPVISNTGNMPVNWYRCGVIKFSRDGAKMAAACNNGAPGNYGGLELYDFDPHSGTLSNATVLDSSGTVGYYYGACFSPDGSKLYATTSSLGYNNMLYYGKVHQFDLSMGGNAAIIASNTIVFTDFSGNDGDRLGDLKRGSDNKVYFVSGKGTAGVHRINSPNLSGLACNVTANAIMLLTGNTERGLPNDIALINHPDTIYSTKSVNVCFRESAVIIADSGKRYQWQNGTNGRSQTVDEDGTYIVGYVNMDCRYEIDSYKVHFIPLPAISNSGYSCPGANQGKIWIIPRNGDNTSIKYNWKNEAGIVLQQHQSNMGDTLKNVDTGTYYVQITTSSGCDTILQARIESLPVPKASFTADSVICEHIPLSFTNTSDAPLWKWYFGDGNYSDQQNPDYSYSHRGSYTALLVITNIEGCSDTLQKEIIVKGLDLKLTANKDRVNKDEVITLRSTGIEPYTVTAWEPIGLFADQVAYSQSVVMDTSRTFFIKGMSSFGCKAQAEVSVTVNPIVFIPSAFSPNGDGLNDRFKPSSSGYFFVRFFEIYNRWGQQVYSAYGKSALEGWDGTFNGKQQDLGVYYYLINLETDNAGTISVKGDVTLVR